MLRWLTVIIIAVGTVASGRHALEMGLPANLAMLVPAALALMWLGARPHRWWRSAVAWAMAGVCWASAAGLVSHPALVNRAAHTLAAGLVTIIFWDIWRWLEPRAHPLMSAAAALGLTVSSGAMVEIAEAVPTRFADTIYDLGADVAGGLSVSLLLAAGGLIHRRQRRRADKVDP